MRIQQHPNTGKRTLIESNGYPTIEAVSSCQGRFSLRMVKFLEKLSLAHRLARDGIFYRVEEFLGLSTAESEYIKLNWHSAGSGKTPQTR